MSEPAPWILVVDDDDDIRDVVGIILESEGYRVTGAADGVQALERLTGRSAPCVILLDLMMPRMNGADFMKALKSDPARSYLPPVIVLSGNRAVRETAEAIGAQSYLVKPMEMEDLLQEVRRFAGAPQALLPGGPTTRP